MCQQLRLVPATTHPMQDVLQWPAVDISNRTEPGRENKGGHEMSESPQKSVTPSRGRLLVCLPF